MLRVGASGVGGIYHHYHLWMLLQSLFMFSHFSWVSNWNRQEIYSFLGCGIELSRKHIFLGCWSKPPRNMGVSLAVSGKHVTWITTQKHKHVLPSRLLLTRSNHPNGMEWSEVKWNETLELEVHQGAIFLNLNAIYIGRTWHNAICHLRMISYGIKHHTHDPNIPWTTDLAGETQLTCYSSLQETLLQATTRVLHSRHSNFHERAWAGIQIIRWDYIYSYTHQYP